jgi:hypothetical protein
MTTAQPPVWSRFAKWPQLPARLLLLALLAIVVAAALVPINSGKTSVRTTNAFEVFVKDKPETPATGGYEDLELYERAIARITKGEHYYDFIAAEHRAAHYPVRPGLAVRLPTLAYLNAWLTPPGLVVASILLVLAVGLAWWRRLGEEPGGPRYRMLAMALLMVGASLGLNRDFFVLHEQWAGMLLALSMGLHRPGRYWGALLAAALALAIREHSLPFVLLMAAMAFWRGDRREGIAWSLLVMLFLAVLAVHLQIIAAQALPSDPLSPSWWELRGLSGWLSNVVLSSNLRLIPHWLGGPLVMLAIFGWASWRNPAGTFATLLYLGYGLAFMVAGRGDNYYWGFMVSPALLAGLAFMPMGLMALWRSVRLR